MQSFFEVICHDCIVAREIVSMLEGGRDQKVTGDMRADGNGNVFEILNISSGEAETIFVSSRTWSRQQRRFVGIAFATIYFQMLDDLKRQGHPRGYYEVVRNGCYILAYGWRVRNHVALFVIDLSFDGGPGPHGGRPLSDLADGAVTISTEAVLTRIGKTFTHQQTRGDPIVLPPHVQRHWTSIRLSRTATAPWRMRNISAQSALISRKKNLFFPESGSAASHRCAWQPGVQDPQSGSATDDLQIRSQPLAAIGEYDDPATVEAPKQKGEISSDQTSSDPDTSADESRDPPGGMSNLPMRMDKRHAAPGRSQPPAATTF
ncbi:MAG: hypothetical protein NW217_01475 [Hyphomicrobiaceae bacterium]|nr:hypothetical protein [Hyphomicrobiaceae bacterium]